MSLELADYEKKARRAIREFWISREQARQNQIKSGKADQGERASATAGKNMDGFITLVKDVVQANGLDRTTIFEQRRLLTLPGYYRPTKSWDLLVINREHLIAAIEFKSQVGPSFGNNFNNRAEEAIGNAHDLWTAYREGAFGVQSRPFVGWLMLLEDAPASRAPVDISSPHFEVFEEFREASYAERYRILCQKLVQEQLYTSATILISPRSSFEDGAYFELDEMTGLRTFVTELAGHIAASAARS